LHRLIRQAKKRSRDNNAKRDDDCSLSHRDNPRLSPDLLCLSPG